MGRNPQVENCYSKVSGMLWNHLTRCFFVVVKQFWLLKCTVFKYKNDYFKYGGRSNNLVYLCGSSVCLSTPETRRTLMQMHMSNDGGSAVEPDPRMLVFRKQKLLWNGWCLYHWELGLRWFLEPFGAVIISEKQQLCFHPRVTMKVNKERTLSRRHMPGENARKIATVLTVLSIDVASLGNCYNAGTCFQEELRLQV